jgi:hypothetical protein
MRPGERIMTHAPYDPRAQHRTNGADTATWTALAFGVLFGMVLGLYALSETNSRFAANERAIEQTPPTTTGQGGTR